MKGRLHIRPFHIKTKQILYELSSFSKSKQSLTSSGQRLKRFTCEAVLIDISKFTWVSFCFYPILMQYHLIDKCKEAVKDELNNTL